MKKTKIILPILAVMGALGALTSCGDTTSHIHSKSKEFSYDENGHYYACEECEENIRFDYEEHSFIEKDGLNTCSVCGYIQNQELEVTYKSFKKAIENYRNDKTATMSLTFGQYSKENDITTYGYESKGIISVDAERSLTFSKGTNTQIEYEDDGSISDKYESIYETAYIKDSDNNFVFYKRNGDSKLTYKTDKYLADKYFEEQYLMSEYFDVLYYTYLPSFSSYKKVLDNTYTVGGYASAFVKHSVNNIEDGFEYSVEVNQTNAYTSSLSIRTNLYKFVIKNDTLVSMKLEENNSYSYVNGYSEGYIYSYDISFSYDFDQASYDSFDKSGYTDSGSGETFECNYYYGDYRIGYSVDIEIGETLSTTYVSGAVTYGDVYYDKEFTKKYNGEPVTGNMDKLYVKPTVMEGSYAKVVLLNETTYIDPNGLLEDYKSSSWSSGRDVFINSDEVNYYTVTYTVTNNQTIGKMYVNGVLLEGDKFEIKAGEVYIVEYKKTSYQ